MATSKKKSQQPSILDKDKVTKEESRDERWGNMNVSVENMRKLKGLFKKGVLKSEK